VRRCLKSNWSEPVVEAALDRAGIVRSHVRGGGGTRRRPTTGRRSQTGGRRKSDSMPSTLAAVTDLEKWRCSCALGEHHWPSCALGSAEVSDRSSRVS
jgi:hypothetical protein